MTPSHMRAGLAGLARLHYLFKPMSIASHNEELA